MNIKNISMTPCKQPFNFMKATKCLAKTRNDTTCQSPAMKNGRCRMHGGKSTGAKTKEGLERITKAHLKHGRYTKANISFRKSIMELINDSKEVLKTF